MPAEAAPETANDPAPSQLKKKKKTPEFFSPQAPGEKKAVKKKVVKKVEGQP
jgi:hypothetical protein